MNILKTIKNTLRSSCVYFVAAEFLILILAALFPEIAPNKLDVADLLATFLPIFISCVVVAAFNLVWRLNYSMSIKFIVHFFGMLIAYSIIFIIIPKAYTYVPQFIARLAVFIVIYIVVAFAVFIIRSIKKSHSSEALEYESQFEKKK